MTDVILSRAAAPPDPLDQLIGSLKTPPPYLELLPVAIYACDQDGRLLWFNGKAADLWGCRPKIGDTEERYCGSYRLYLSDRPIAPDETPMALALRTGASTQGAPITIERQDGSRVTIAVRIEAVRDAAGKIIGAINCFHDITDRRRAELALSENEQRLAASYEHAAIGITEVDIKGRRLRANEAACKITGRTREQLVGAVVFDTLHPDDLEDDLSQHRRLVSGEIDRYAVEKRYIRGDGRIAWLSVMCSAVRDAEGKFLYSVRVFNDVTERRRTANDLAQNEQRLAAIYKHMSIGMSEVDADGRVMRVNPSACSITGRSPEELLERNIFDGVFTDQHEEDRQLYADLKAGTIDRYTLEKRYRRGDGRDIWMELMCSAVRDAEGKFLFAVRVFQNITEARMWAQALAESRQRLAATHENAAIAISEVDADGNLLSVNEATCAIIGYPREELIGMNVFDLTHPEDRASDQNLFGEQLSGTKPYAVEKRLRRKDGRWIWAAVAASIVRDSAGRFLYGVRVMQDITDRKRAEEMVRESELRLRQVLEALPAAVYTTDAAGRIKFYNQAAVDLSGRVPNTDIDEWCVTWRLLRPDGTSMPHEECPMAVALKENRPVRDAEIVVERPDGSRATVVPYPTPLYDATGDLIGAVNMMVDITDRKRAEERQRALIDELNHRVKNTLATVQSLAAQTLRGSRVEARARDAFSARLFALSRTHDQLSREGWESADFKSILKDIFAPYQEDGGDQVRLKGESTRLPPQRALLLAMVMHELATNAAKYGALSVPSGKLDVAWAVTSNGGRQTLTIEWRESGGPVVKQPRRQGFGSWLADRAIRNEMNGSTEITFAAEGVHCKFEIPLISLHT